MLVAALIGASVLGAIGILYDPARKLWRANGYDSHVVWMPSPTSNVGSKYSKRSDKIVLLPHVIETSCAHGCKCDLKVITHDPVSSKDVSQTFYCKSKRPALEHLKEHMYGEYCQVTFDVGLGLHQCKTQRMDDPGLKYRGDKESLEIPDETRIPEKVAISPSTLTKPLTVPVGFFNQFPLEYPTHEIASYVKDPSNGFGNTPFDQTTVLALERKLRVVCEDDCNCAIELWRAAVPFVDGKPHMLAGYRCGRKKTMIKSRIAYYRGSKSAKPHCKVTYSLDRGLERCESDFARGNEEDLAKFLSEQRDAIEIDGVIVKRITGRRVSIVTSPPEIEKLEELIDEIPQPDKVVPPSETESLEIIHYESEKLKSESEQSPIVLKPSKMKEALPLSAKVSKPIKFLPPSEHETELSIIHYESELVKGEGRDSVDIPDKRSHAWASPLKSA